MSLYLLILVTLFVYGGMGVAAELIAQQLILQKTLSDVMRQSRKHFVIRSMSKYYSILGNILQ